MLTPGVAGSVVMVIANTLWIEFMIPQKWTALLLSFLFIIPILMKFSASWVENIIYFTFNGLIVFALAVNTNFAGRKLQEISTSDNKVVAQQEVRFKASTSSTDKKGNINQRIIGLQFASNNTQGGTSDASGNNQTDSSKNNDQDKKDTKAKKDKPKQEDRQFFDSWF